MTDARGNVHLVGAGPGAVDLLTLRALDRIQRAQVVVYDRLIAPEIMALVPQSAQRIYVGKGPGHQAMTQQQIHEVLIEHACTGRYVVRLKGGDPYVFGRGGEEIEALREAGIDFEVVPGITAAIGCAAAAAIPLTHRHLAHTCVLLPGHLAKAEDKLDWGALAQPGMTRVFYMGVERVKQIAQRLISHGLPPQTPAAVVQDGTRGQQVVSATELSVLAAEAPEYDHRPGLIFVGETVRLSPHFRSATDRGLSGD